MAVVELPVRDRLDDGGRAERGDGVDLLVRAAIAGDRRAWDALVTRFDRLVWSVARAHRLSDTDAADVAQTTWLRLVEHIGDVQSPERIGAWLATTARRECLRVLRASQRQVPSGHEEIRSDEHEEHDFRAQLDEVARRQAVRAAFLALSPRQQAVLRLLATDPVPSYERIAALVGMPIGSIGPTRARALERLRRELTRAGLEVPGEAASELAATARAA